MYFLMFAHPTLLGDVNYKSLWHSELEMEIFKENRLYTMEFRWKTHLKSLWKRDKHLGIEKEKTNSIL